MKTSNKNVRCGLIRSLKPGESVELREGVVITNITNKSTKINVTLKVKNEAGASNSQDAEGANNEIKESKD